MKSKGKIEKRHISTDFQERFMRRRISVFMNYGLPLALVVWSVQALVRADDSTLRAEAGLGMVCAAAFYLVVSERAKHYKFRRLYKYELNRRVASDKAFHLLRSQFDTEIIESMAALSEPEPESEGDEPSEEYVRGYVQGLVHGRDLIPMDRMEDSEDTVESGSAWKKRRHLKLVTSKPDAD
jgi:hypothetical protein